MQNCTNCPYPRKCLNQSRCIVYKEGVEPIEYNYPEPVPVKTSYGIGMTGVKKKRKAKK
jgi:hypothetical protein